MNEFNNKNAEPAVSTTGAVVGGALGGVAGGAAAGAAVGGMTGPVGALVGAAVGAIAGAVAGKSMSVDPVAEDTYWRNNYSSRPYVNGGTYDDYGPAYQYGANARTKYPNRSFDDLETDLSRDWSTARGNSSLQWESAKHASRDAWQRASDTIERAIPGDSDRDGK